MSGHVSIGGVDIGKDCAPFIIAELSGNHNQSLETALEMVRAAAQAGVQAIKLQTYSADSMTLNSRDAAFIINDPASPWYQQNLYQLYEKAHTPRDWHSAIFDEARSLGLVAFSTPFDTDAVDFLESLDVPAYKIASFENTDVHLIRRVARTGKPVIISTGMATEAELEQCVSTCRQQGCENLILLKCTSSYPSHPAESNLLALGRLQERFSCPVGLSDHTLGIGAALASIPLGAVVIEKHFVLNRKEGGVDAAFSLEPAELKMLVTEVTTAWQALGDAVLGPTASEQYSLKYRRGLYVVNDLAGGDVLSESNLKSLRPALGIPASHWDDVMGKTVKFDVPAGTALSWDMLD